MDGGAILIEYKESHLKGRYLDAHTGEVSPKHLSNKAIGIELS